MSLRSSITPSCATMHSLTSHCTAQYYRTDFATDCRHPFFVDFEIALGHVQLLSVQVGSSR